jgi:E3 ubiquitin-protein ligase RAD18
MALQRRHSEWINIWNANCDSTNARSRRELLQDLETWEKSQNRPPQAPSTGMVMDKGFDGPTWASSHGNDFKDLIAQARKTRKPSQAAKEEDVERGPEFKESDEAKTHASSGEVSMPEGVGANDAHREGHFNDIDLTQSHQV